MRDSVHTSRLSRGPKPRGVARAVLALSGLVLLLACFAGCHVSQPDLFDIHELSARSFETGDRLEFTGNGFPEGREATIVFDGTLYRPGERPLSGARVVAHGMSQREGRLSVTVDEGLVRGFTGVLGTRTTFHGNVSVTFAARGAAFARVGSRLLDVSFDIAPSVPSPQSEMRSKARSSAFQTYLGVTLATGPEGLVIAGLDKGGRAARSGLALGDAVESLGELRVQTPLDFVPPLGERSVALKVRRGHVGSPTNFWIDIDGFQPLDLVELAGAVFMLIAASAIAIVLSGRGFRRVTLTALGLGKRESERARTSAKKAPATGAVFLLLPYLGFVGISGFFTFLLFDQVLIARELDLPLAWLTSVSWMLSAALVVGGKIRKSSGATRWSLRAGAKTSLSALCLLLPAFAALATVLLAGSTFGAADVLSGVGPFPWQWRAFRSPALLGATLLVLLSMSVKPFGARVPLGGARSAGDFRVGVTPMPGLGSSILLLADWGHVLVLANIVVMVFLGAGEIGQAGIVSGGAFFAAASIVVFQAKALVLTLLVFLARRFTQGVRADELMGWWWRRAVPASLAVVVLQLGWSRIERLPEWNTALEPLALGLFLATTILLGIFALLARKRAVPEAHAVNPWL